MFYVYAHARNSDNRLFYIGKGKGRRAWETRGRNQYWHRVANKHGWTPIVLIDGLSEPEALTQEIAMIKAIGREHLTNGTDGGQGMSGYVMPEQVKAKIATAHIGMRPNAETRRKLSEHAKIRKASEEQRAKLSTALRNNQHARDQRKRIFYHPQHGQFIGDAHEFNLMTNEHPTKLIKGRKLHIKGWVYIGLA